MNKDISIFIFVLFLDENGLMCVGGRLNKVVGILLLKEINLIIFFKNSYIFVFLICYFYE